MANDNQKSTAITNLDASPIVANTAGHGAPALLHHVDGFITASANADAASLYRLVRVPSKAIMKHLFFESEAQGAGKVNLSLYYSDSTTDGTTVASGVIVPTTGDQLFASDIDCAAAVASADRINESGNFTWAMRQKQLWDAAGLTTDPGGFFDIVAVVHTTAITTGTGKLGCSAIFVY